MYDPFRSYLDECVDDLFRRQTASEQSDGVPLPVLQRRLPFGSALPRKTRFFTYTMFRYRHSPSLPVLSGEQDVLQACVDNLADFPSLSPTCPVLFRAL